MEKSCKNCESCKRLYRRYNYTIDRFKGYYCLTKKILIEGDVCESYKPKRNREYDLSSDRFDKAEEDIRSISERVKINQQ